jgi:arylsulfatase A-like enzyme
MACRVRTIRHRRGLLILAVIGLVVLAALSAWQSHRSPLQASNTSLVLLVVDTLRADHVGAWGYPFDTTPVIDSYAEQGVRFTRAFTTAAWTRPAMASLLTGLFARTAGVYEEWHDELPGDLVTLAERLRKQGYVTLGVTANLNISRFHGFDQGFDVYEEAVPRDKKEPSKNIAAGPKLTDRALSLVDRHISELAERPLFLQALYVDPHLPHLAPQELVQEMSASGSQHSEYDAEIRLADIAIGQLLDGLAERGLLDDALVVITSDHGEGLDSHPGAPLAKQHGHYLYDSVVHVPLVLWHPELPHGRTVDVLASLVDVVPTLLDLLDLPHAGDEIQGRSLAAFVLGRVPFLDRPDHVFIETDWRVSRKVAVRSERHKLVRNDDCRLYQQEGVFEGRKLNRQQRRVLSELPLVEVHEVAKGEQPDPPPRSLAGVADRLTDALESWEARTPSRRPTNRAEQDVVTFRDGTVVSVGSRDREPDEQTLEALRALGYLSEP